MNASEYGEDQKQQDITHKFAYKSFHMSHIYPQALVNIF